MIDETITALRTEKERLNAGNARSVEQAEVFRDLLVLKLEFSDVEIDLRQKTMAVVTRPIVLDGLILGEFQILLYLDTLGDPDVAACYDVIAVDPVRSMPNEDVTHPHVEANRLCEGDARPAIALALAQGRLLDFFQIVEQVLLTYNPSSAYVAITNWEGSNCGECGCLTSSDETIECAGCEKSLCDSCTQACEKCGDSFCDECDKCCCECGENFCKFCLSECAVCSAPICSDCQSENERCDDCEEETNEEAESGTTPAPVHAECVGKAVVSA